MSLITSDKEPILKQLRGVEDLGEARLWLKQRGIEDIECITPDLAGVARGKLMPADKFFSSPVMAMPSSVFTTTITSRPCTTTVETAEMSMRRWDCCLRTARRRSSSALGW